jgi:hypothetical protein
MNGEFIRAFQKKTAGACMNEGIKIRPARNAEIPTLARLIENQLPDMMAGRKRPDNIEHHLAEPDSRISP